jgi:dolichol-phosphate mannosyltransferase
MGERVGGEVRESEVQNSAKAFGAESARTRGSEKLALVIPTLREAANMGPLLKRTRAALDGLALNYEVIVVDDDSGDGIEEAVRAAVVDEGGRDDARFRVLVRRGERGLAGAVLDGWAATDAEWLGVMDADLQHPPELLGELVGAMRAGADVAVGSRYRQGGSMAGWNAARKLTSLAAVWAAKPLLLKKGRRASDPMSGFFIVRRECVEGVGLYRRGFKLLLDILVRGDISETVEKPFAFGLRRAGQSKASVGVAVEYFWLLMRLYGGRVTGRGSGRAE